MCETSMANDFGEVFVDFRGQAIGREGVTSDVEPMRSRRGGKRQYLSAAMCAICGYVLIFGTHTHISISIVPACLSCSRRLRWTQKCLYVFEQLNAADPADAALVRHDPREVPVCLLC